MAGFCCPDEAAVKCPLGDETMLELRSGNHSRVMRRRAGAVLAGVGASLALGAIGIAAQPPPTTTEAYPDLSSTEFGWIKDSDSFVSAPTGGPGPVTFDPAHPYQPNNDSGLQVTYR